MQLFNIITQLNITIIEYKIFKFICLIKVHEWNIAQDSIKSKLEIDPGTQMDAGVYECSADNKYSIDRRSFKTDFSIAFES